MGALYRPWFVVREAASLQTACTSHRPETPSGSGHRSEQSPMTCCTRQDYFVGVAGDAAAAEPLPLEPLGLAPALAPTYLVHTTLRRSLARGVSSWAT